MTARALVARKRVGLGGGDYRNRELGRVDWCESVELAARMANTKTTREATTTPRPMYIHHIGHLEDEDPHS
jgi:hypothetical protein